MENKKKYELLKDDTIKVGISTLYRIKALRDFGNVKKGDLGGYIEKEDNLSHSCNCWVYDNAKVYGNALVCNNAEICGHAKVCEYAVVYDNARICEYAEVFSRAIVFENAEVYGNAKVHENARVYGNAKIFYNVEIYGNANIYGNSQVFDNTEIYGNANIYGNALIKTNDDYATIQGFGSVNRTTTFFKTKDGNIGVSCGCFSGNLQEFKDKVIETHKDTYLAKEYLIIADLMEMRFNNRNTGKH